MSDEESPSFKVVDRRRFSSDGVVRESEDIPDSEPEPQPEPQKTGSVASQPAPPSPSEPVTSQTQESRDGPATPESQSDEGGLRRDREGMDFLSFIASLATNALAAMGALPPEQSGGLPRNPQLAKEYINILVMLRDKTKGNLSPQEDQSFERLVGDLQMQYVKLVGVGT